MSHDEAVSYIDSPIMGIILHEQQQCTHNGIITATISGVTQIASLLLQAVESIFFGVEDIKMTTTERAKGETMASMGNSLSEDIPSEIQWKPQKWIGCTFPCTFWRHCDTFELL